MAKEKPIELDKTLVDIETELGNLIDHTPEYEGMILNLYEDIPELAKDKKNYIDKQKTAFPEVDAYANYANTRIIISRKIVDDIGAAVGTIKKPIAVFRDILIEEDAAGYTYLEYYFGLQEYNNSPNLIFLKLNRNVIIEFNRRSIKGDYDKLLDKSGGQMIKRIYSDPEIIEEI